MECVASLTYVPLRLGRLEPQGYQVFRSEIKWVRGHGHLCKCREIFAFCNVAFSKSSGTVQSIFSGEERDFQVAFAPRRAGRVYQLNPTSPGGYVSPQFHAPWVHDDVLCQFEPLTGSREGGQHEELELLMLAGRRMTELAEVRSGLLSGWHERSRAWWDDGVSHSMGTLLSAGICEQAGIIRGESCAFLEMFQTLGGSAQVVMIQDEPLVPSVQVLTDQLRRTPEQSQAIAEDLLRTLGANSGPAPHSADWMFFGALLSGLQRTPLTDDYEVVTPNGLRRSGPADALVLSSDAEFPHVLEHRRLGYRLNIYDFRLREAGVAVRSWLRENFEAKVRSSDDVLRDYREFLAEIKLKSSPLVLVINSIATNCYEEIETYAGFDPARRQSSRTVRAKELNLVLHDLARESDVAIIDADAIAADLGAGGHAPDGVHQSGHMHAEVRAEILRVLRDRRVPGFTRGAT